MNEPLQVPVNVRLAKGSTLRNKDERKSEFMSAYVSKITPMKSVTLVPKVLIL